MVGKPNEDTKPRVQRLFVGSYSERDMWSQDLASAGFCGYNSFNNMRKQFTILLILIFILGLVPVNFSIAITQNQIDAEVQIVCTDGAGSWFSGSGTIIDPKGIILTNRHVIEGAYMNTCFIGFIELISQEPDFGTEGNGGDF